MGVKFTGKWPQALKMAKTAKAAVTKALLDEGNVLADKLRASLAAGRGEALHPLTAALKGSQAPLSGMERWVTVKKLTPFRVFVGFVDPDGIRFGLIHEEGRSWTMVWTAQQRKWFFAMMSRFGLLDDSGSVKGTGTGEIHYETPARPWLQPFADANLPDAQERINAAVAAAVWK